jgi:adenylate cyclase
MEGRVESREIARGALTEGELARRSDSTPERIRQLVRIGVLRPDTSGRYAPADVQRVRIVAAYEAGGIELGQLAVAISQRRMSFEYADRIYPEASPGSGLTLADLAARLGPSGALLPDLYLALGLPRPDPDRPLTEDDARLIPAFLEAWSMGVASSDTVLRAARLLGDSARRASEGWVDLFLEAIAPPPEERDESSLDELAPRLFDPAMRISRLLEPAMTWLLRHHMERALDAANVEAMERALEARGLRPRRTADPPAVVFADLSGFTRLTEEHGDEAAVGFAAGLSREASRVAGDHRGRLVKQLGDGVMLAFQHVGDALGAAFALRRTATAAGLPALHTGIAAGPVVERDGDYFGRTVNLASRLSGVAGPDEIVADTTTVEHAVGIRATALGAHELKGLRQPIPVFRLEQPSDDYSATGSK